MNTCDTCQHWTVVERPRIVRRGDLVHAWRKCANPKLNDPNSRVPRSKLRTVPRDHAGPAYDSGDPGPFLMTGPKFGCIHHEKPTMKA